MGGSLYEAITELRIGGILNVLAADDFHLDLLAGIVKFLADREFACLFVTAGEMGKVLERKLSRNSVEMARVRIIDFSGHLSRGEKGISSGNPAGLALSILSSIEAVSGGCIVFIDAETFEKIGNVPDFLDFLKREISSSKARGVFFSKKRAKGGGEGEFFEL